MRRFENMVGDRARFVAAFMQSPFRTASLTPSSTYLAEAMLAEAGLAEARAVVELGPGTGVFTRAIDRSLPPHADLLCLEINPDFARLVARSVPRARVVNDSAENLALHLKEAGPSVDCVISGLPWVILSQSAQERLLRPVVRALRQGGTFTTFAYTHAAWLPAGRRFRCLLESNFARVEASSHIWRNLPPAFVYRCRK